MRVLCMAQKLWGGIFAKKTYLIFFMAVCALIVKLRVLQDVGVRQRIGQFYSSSTRLGGHISPIRVGFFTVVDAHDAFEVAHSLHSLVVGFANEKKN